MYDVTIDLPGNHPWSDPRRALTPDGTYVSIGHDQYSGAGHRWFGSLGRFGKLLVISPFVNQLHPIRGAKDPGDRLVVLKELIEAGKVMPVVDRTFQLSEVPEAIRYLESDGPLGRSSAASEADEADAATGEGETRGRRSSLGREGRLAMAKLIYSAITSLDGYVADEDGNFDWAEPDEEMHTFVNELERSVGTYLYGRRMYEVMGAWETMDLSEQPPFIQDYAQIWRAADKIVYSKTLETVSNVRTRLERDFDPGSIRQMKAQVGADISVGGPDLAAQAIEAGLVDECRLFLTPIVVGGGKRSLPKNVRLKLELLDERRFGNGVVHLHYRSRT